MHTSAFLNYWRSFFAGQTVRLALAWFAIMLFGTGVTVESKAEPAQLPELFIESKNQPLKARSSEQRWIRSETRGTISLEALTGNFAVKLGTQYFYGERAISKLIDTPVATAEIYRGDLKNGAGQTTGTYTITTSYGADASLGSYGVFRLNNGSDFELRQKSDTEFELLEIASAHLPECAGSVHHGDEAKVDSVDLPQLLSAASTADTIEPTQIDLMVVYSPRARVSSGGANALRPLISTGVALANDAYLNSGVLARLNLVHTHELSSEESGNFDQDLKQLSDSSDGVWDEVQGLRDRYGADLVMMLADSVQYCGVAYLMNDELDPRNPDSGYSVVSHHCIGSRFTMAHELGHNLGADHDVLNSSGGAYSYSHGYRFVNANNVEFGTIMAYGPNRLNFFSNPELLFDEIPLGTSQHNNAATINLTRQIVAGYRASQVIIDQMPGEPLDTTAPYAHITLRRYMRSGILRLRGRARAGEVPITGTVIIKRLPHLNASLDLAQSGITVRELNVDANGRFKTGIRRFKGGAYFAQLKHAHNITSTPVVIRHRRRSSYRE